MKTHAYNALEPDRTLCGVASEGDHELPPPRYAKIGEYVTCPECVRVIEFVQNSFTPSMLRF